ncbi:MAG: hypothetical protein K2K91_10580 [Ruminococcus sp.]|nr:hypothetical protein [Ruminococcus sp.]
MNKEYINNLKIENIPWDRMVTAYDKAENYSELLKILDEMKDLDKVKKAWNSISDFEHQSTMYTPAPFVLVFLVRIYEKAVNLPDNPVAVWLSDKLADEFKYYAEVCSDAEKMEHAELLENMSDILNDKYLLPKGFDLDPEYDDDEDFDDEEDIVDVDEFIASLFPEDLFYSLYYYSAIILKNYKK